MGDGEAGQGEPGSDQGASRRDQGKSTRGVSEEGPGGASRVIFRREQGCMRLISITASRARARTNQIKFLRDGKILLVWKRDIKRV